jgi:AcrR family transcriptional regulator
VVTNSGGDRLTRVTAIPGVSPRSYSPNDIGKPYRPPAGFPDTPAWFDAGIVLRHPEHEGMRATIIDAARRCAILYGEERMSMGDVAAAARVSRGSVYKYFHERAELTDALHEWVLHEYSYDLGRAMDGHDDLEDQLVAGVHIARWWYDCAVRLHWNEELPRDYFTVRSGAILQAIMTAVEPRIKTAAANGVIRGDIPVDVISEWVARMIHSMAVNPGVTFNQQRPNQVAKFVRPFFSSSLR